MTLNPTTSAVSCAARMTCAMALALALTAPLHAQDHIPEDVDTYIKENQSSLTLLDKGAFQVSLSFSAALAGAQSDFGSRSATSVSAGTSLAYGISKRIEVFAELPYAVTTQREEFLAKTTQTTMRQLSAGVGVRGVLGFETQTRPEIVASLSATSPVGRGMGGQPSLRIGLAATKTFDPIMLSAGIGYTVTKDTSPAQIDLAASFDFAVNDQVSFGAGLGWASDGTNFADARHDGVSLGLRAGISSLDGASTLSPSVTLGATNGAPDAVLGINWARKW